MEDLAQSARISALGAPVVIIARELLACDEAVQSVMVLDDGGRTLAYERALGKRDPLSEECPEYQFLFMSPESGVLLSVRLKTPSMHEDLRKRIAGIFGQPLPLLTR